MAQSDADSPIRTKPWEFGLIATDEFGELEQEYVLRVLNKRRVFRFHGQDKSLSEAQQLENLYTERLGVKHGLAVNAGTSALISALIGAGIGPGDEVIVPGFTYIATAAAVIVARAVPVIVDIDESLTMDPQAFEAAITPHTKAVMPVHMRGVPARMDEIMSVARKHNLIVIEDVAQANGGSYKGKPLGTFGHAGCFSFQQHKLVTAGEGGMMVTNDDTIFTRASIYHDSAFIFWGMNIIADYEVFAGENYRLCELNAALALAQSQRIDSLIAKLRDVKKRILAGIRDLEQLQLQDIPDPAGDVSYSIVFFLKDQHQSQRFSELLLREGIPCGTISNKGIANRHIFSNWTYILNKRGISDKDNPWENQHYKGNVQYPPDLCLKTLEILGRAITLNLHQKMTDEDCDDIVNAIRKAASKLWK